MKKKKDEKKPKLDDVSQLSLLGSNTTQYKYDEPCPSMLQTFPNRHPEGRYFVDLEFPEFTSLCPKTGQPDFATIRIKYVPKALCLESKSIKLYFFAFRNYGAFMESITNKILRDFVEACHPQWMEVVGVFAPRGALAITVRAGYDENEGFTYRTLEGECL